MRKLYIFGPGFGLPDPSPFCVKSIALLRLAELDFELEAGDPTKAPKGKLPWLDDNDRQVADSTFIRFYLEQEHGVDFYPGLSAADKATAWAFEKMCEEHLYFAVVHERWMIETNFQKGSRKFFDAVPAVMRPLVIGMVKRQIRRDLKGHGMGRHSYDEIIQLARHDIDAIADFLSSKSYFMGDEPTGADATIGPFIMGAMAPKFPGPLCDAVMAHPNLITYAKRIADHWFPGEVAFS